MNDKIIPYSKQYIFQKDIRIINSVLKSQFLMETYFFQY